MGLYRIKFKNYSKQLLVNTIIEMGYNVIRTEVRDIGEYYFYNNSDGKEKSFWISNHGGDYYWCCGMGPGVDSIIKEFGSVGLFP